MSFRMYILGISNDVYKFTISVVLKSGLHTLHLSHNPSLRTLENILLTSLLLPIV